MAAHDRQLMAEDQDLDILVVGGAEVEHDQVKGASGRPVEKLKGHDRQPAG